MSGKNSNLCHLDFLLTGFPKCGTTTLDTILRQHSEIELPVIKETQFYYIDEKYNNKHALDLKKYYNMRENVVRGAIEPSFLWYAEKVAADFSNDLKIIFMIRNPVEALASFFRMNLRYVENTVTLQYYNGINRTSSIADKFNRYVNEFVIKNEFKMFNYYHWISKYMNFFPLNNIKVIYFEDFCNDPVKVIDEVQGFIGVKHEKIKCDYHENSGKMISKGRKEAYINHCIRSQLTYLRQCPRAYIMYDKLIYSPLHKILIENNNEPMHQNTKETLKRYYYDDVSELSKLLNKPLLQMWKII